MEPLVHVDDRGRLLAMELDQVAHPVQRIFVVTDCPAGVERGHHPVPCRQTIVLVAGGVVVWLDDARHRLEEPGERLSLPVGAYVRYTLDGPASTLVVLAEAPYAPMPAEEIM